MRAILPKDAGKNKVSDLWDSSNKVSDLWDTLFLFPIVTNRDNGALLFVGLWCKIYAAKGSQFDSLGIVKKCDSGLVSKAFKVWPRPEARPK